MRCTDKPSEPQNLQVTEVTKETVGLRWEPPESSGGMDIAQYVVDKRDATRGGGWMQAATVDGTATRVVVGKLVEGNEYQFRVVAENKIGAGPPAELSQPVTAKLPYGTRPDHPRRHHHHHRYHITLRQQMQASTASVSSVYHLLGGLRNRRCCFCVFVAVIRVSS